GSDSLLTDEELLALPVDVLKQLRAHQLGFPHLLTKGMEKEDGHYTTYYRDLGTTSTYIEEVMNPQKMLYLVLGFVPWGRYFIHDEAKVDTGSNVIRSLIEPE